MKRKIKEEGSGVYFDRVLTFSNKMTDSERIFLRKKGKRIRPNLNY